ncbi:MAG TPA: thymidine phosphorylase [Blastocatellia bacterium]|nr:thymidine phosphorylase [Blastocatellia bacterium]
MRAVDIIIRKRDGAELSREEIRYFIRGYTSAAIADYQMSALVMAIFLRGMTTQETIALTEEMLHSGEVLDFSDLGRPRIDKHSTGGVGDKTSLVIAPVVGAAGVLVPMISGRALAHSGGTLDKLESIPGFRVDLTLEEFRRTLERVGVALIGQTAEIAPADRKLYALRDVTGTVPCIPLIAGSIMSKKLAEGISGLVLDVKTGSGAFMKGEGEATGLAELLIEIARRMEKDCVALVTDMSQPLGRAVGNAVEVIEAFEALHGRGPADFITICRELSAEMLVMGGAAASLEEARKLYDNLIESGAALEKMREIIAEQGGNPQAVDDYSLLPRAKNERAVISKREGFVETIDTEQIGRAAMLLGAGRDRLDTSIDLGVGLRVEARIGDRVETGSPLVTLLFNDEARAIEAESIIHLAFRIGGEQIRPPGLIKRRLT